VIRFMNRFTIIILGVMFFPLLAFAQYEEAFCDSVYDHWNKPSGFTEHPDLPEIEGGLVSIHNNLVYPDSAIKAGLEENIKVWLIVSKKGIPECIRFVELENDIFKPTILNAINKQKFKPVIVNEKPVDRPLLIPFNFKLK
ncbi:MAG: energy transducer TonB, partial [Phycisphaerales bacterium]